MLKIYEVEHALESILRRKPIDEFPVSPAMRRRTLDVFGEDLSPDEAVRRILKDVRLRGDEALLEWTRKLDGVVLTVETLEVSDDEIAAAYDLVDSEIVAALERAADRIRAFHNRQPFHSWMDSDLGGLLGQIIRPLERVGVYSPGGTAPLASTLLMTAIPARAAGVDEVVVCSPADRTTGKVAPITLVAADIAEVDAVYAVGGAQAIGALAYGTSTIPRVDKIAGPGNTFVVLAKKHVFGAVGIDALPGPTETVVVADDSANPAWVAADLLAQSEHTGGTAILITPSLALAHEVDRQLQKQVNALATAADILESFESRSGAVITEDLMEAVALADDFAPEHLCLSVRDPWAWVGKIRNAGGIFVGEQSYEVLGDYVAGPSHTMPTGGTARFTSPCNVLDFVRVTNVIALDEITARQIAPVAIQLAEAEGLPAHAAAARIRLVNDR
ncbi:MAG: histidinol dehydrogenase [Anaerolineae bacterium]|nr:histidinol dehydrogenase [Thermoflexales bacterium]MDW8406761.1 histidinol dehydrogenase [Anaerolineae bacterium]